MCHSPDAQAAYNSFKVREGVKDQIIERYRHFTRKNSVPLDWETLDGFTPRGRLDWAAVDSGVRSSLLWRVLSEFDQISPADRRRFKYVRTVVVSSRDWFVDFSAAHEFDVSAIKNDIERRFAGINFVGVIEPGYYPRWHQIGMPIEQRASWHAHLVVYVDHHAALNRAINGHCEAHIGPLFGVPSATTMRRSWKSAPQWISYACKTPTHSYTTRRFQEYISPKTGEIYPEHDRQKPQDLRPGEHVKMRNVMRSFTMDDLMVCGGDGARLFEPVYQQMARDRDQARARFQRPYDKKRSYV